MLSGGRGEDEKNEKRVGFLTFSGWSARDRSWDFTGMCKTNVDGNVFLKATQTKTREMIFQVCTVKGGPSWHTQYLSISSLINHSTSISPSCAWSSFPRCFPCSFSTSFQFEMKRKKRFLIYYLVTSASTIQRKGKQQDCVERPKRSAVCTKMYEQTAFYLF